MFYMTVSISEFVLNKFPQSTLGIQIASRGFFLAKYYKAFKRIRGDISKVSARCSVYI